MGLFTQGISKQEFAARWEASREKLYRFAYCYVKNEQDALEILSEATCRAYCALHQLKEPEYFDSWMGQIVVRAARDHLRKQKRVVPDSEIAELADSASGTDEYEQSNRRMDVYAALDQIPVSDRSYIILKYFEEKSFPEIAAITQTPEATVKTRVYRALKKMRLYLDRTEELR